MTTIEAREQLLSEKLYPFSEIAKMNLFPTKVTARSIRRYAHEGRNTYGGITVFLEFLRTPHGCATSKEACVRFLRNLNTY